MQSRVVTGLLTRHNTLRRHLYLMGLIAHFVGSVEQRMKPQPIFFVGVEPWLHLGMRIWGPSFWSHRILRMKVWGPSGTLVKRQGWILKN
jgi:hypothetical protein